MFQSLEARSASPSAWTASAVDRLRRARENRIVTYAAAPFLMLSGVVLAGSAVALMAAAVVADRVVGKGRL